MTQKNKPEKQPQTPATPVPRPPQPPTPSLPKSVGGTRPQIVQIFGPRPPPPPIPREKQVVAPPAANGSHEYPEREQKIGGVTVTKDTPLGLLMVSASDIPMEDFRGPITIRNLDECFVIERTTDAKGSYCSLRPRNMVVANGKLVPAHSFAVDAVPTGGSMYYSKKDDLAIAVVTVEDLEVCLLVTNRIGRKTYSGREVSEMYKSDS